MTKPCPHCHQPTITTAQQLALSFIRRTIVCRSCRSYVRVDPTRDRASVLAVGAAFGGLLGPPILGWANGAEFTFARAALLLIFSYLSVVAWRYRNRQPLAVGEAK